MIGRTYQIVRETRFEQVDRQPRRLFHDLKNLTISCQHYFNVSCAITFGTLQQYSSTNLIEHNVDGFGIFDLIAVRLLIQSQKAARRKLNTEAHHVLRKNTYLTQQTNS